MVVTRVGDILIGTNAERIAFSTTNLLTYTKYYETDTRATYVFDTGVWNAIGGITTLAGLTGDVAISSPASNNILRYNSGTSKWTNVKEGSGSIVEQSVTRLSTVIAAGSKINWVLDFGAGTGTWLVSALYAICIAEPP